MKQPDEVDQILSEWGAVRPDLDLAPLAVFSRITRITKHLNRARAQAFERSGLASWEFDVLAALRRGGHPFRQSPKRLVQQTLVSSGTMTNRIDRLKQRGLVERATDPSDRRGALVTLTHAGRTRVDAAITRLIDAESELLGGMTAPDQKRLSTLLRHLLVSLD